MDFVYNKKTDVQVSQTQKPQSHPGPCQGPLHTWGQGGKPHTPVTARCYRTGTFYNHPGTSATSVLFGHKQKSIMDFLMRNPDTVQTDRQKISSICDATTYKYPL